MKMNAMINKNLQDAFRKTKSTIGLLLERDSELEQEHCDRHDKEIESLSEVLEHLRLVEREFWD
jgi:hypothetical protein